jgi:hypothetical protein
VRDLGFFSPSPFYVELIFPGMDPEQNRLASWRIPTTPLCLSAVGFLDALVRDMSLSTEYLTYLGTYCQWGVTLQIDVRYRD